MRDAAIPPIIDCHGHLLTKWLAQDAFAVRGMLERGRRYGLEASVVSVDCSSGEPELDLDLLRRLFDAHGVRLAITLGFEPPSDPRALASWPQRLDKALSCVERLSRLEEVKGVGEVGLDHYWPAQLFAEAAKTQVEDDSLRPALKQCHQAQAEVFQRWIELAGALDLPLVVHERQAHGQARQILDRGGLPPDRVMFHCFGSTAEDAASAAQQGYWVSIPSSVVLRPPYQEAAAAAPLERLLVETDAPYHSPLPGLWKRALEEATKGMEGQALPAKERDRAIQQERARLFFDALERDFPGLEFVRLKQGEVERIPAAVYLRSSKARYQNEPFFVRCAAREIAGIKGLTMEQTCASLAQNARDCFGLS